MDIRALIVSLILLAFPVAKAQFPAIANAIYGPDSLLYGIKNVVGGVLAADKVHHSCMQKTLCSEFAPEVVEVEERFDPVKRTQVRVPRVVQRRGRLRWIGDAVANGVGKLADLLRVNPYTNRANRRQGLAAGNTLAARAVEFVVANWEKIPLQQIFQ